MIVFKQKRPDFVLELSSRAVKKITLDDRITIRTNTKQFLNSQGKLDPIKFKEVVVPVIKQLWSKNKLGKCIATALYRTIKNKDEILNIIKEEIGADVDIISGKEEAELIKAAVAHEFPRKHLLVIDAGGMSTEVCVIPGNYSKSFRNDRPIVLDPSIKNNLSNDKNLLIVVTGESIYKIGHIIENPVIELEWHTPLQTILKQIGVHPVVGTLATPGLGYLLKN